MFKKNFRVFNILACFALVAGQASFSLGHANENGKPPKTPIKKLTSSEKAAEVADDLPEAPRISSNINVHSLGIGLGQTFLNGDLQDNGDDSITADIFYNYSASHSFDLSVNVHSSSHKLGAKRASLHGAAVGIKAKLYQFDAFSPYALGGLGFYGPKVKRELNGSLKESKSKVTFGTHLGLGCELKLNRRFTVGILGHYHNPFDVKQETDPEVEGSYYKLLITTLYSF